MHCTCSFVTYARKPKTNYIMLCHYPCKNRTYNKLICASLKFCKYKEREKVLNSDTVTNSHWSKMNLTFFCTCRYRNWNSNSLIKDISLIESEAISLVQNRLWGVMKGVGDQSWCEVSVNFAMHLGSDPCRKCYQLSNNESYLLATVWTLVSGS